MKSHSNKIGVSGGHYKLPDQRDPTRHPKNEILFSKNSATKRRKHLPRCLWKSRLLEKHSRALYTPIHLLTCYVAREKNCNPMCVTKMQFPPWGAIFSWKRWACVFDAPPPKKKEGLFHPPANHCPLLPTACVIPCIPSGYFSFQSHIKEYILFLQLLHADTVGNTLAQE